MKEEPKFPLVRVTWVDAISQVEWMSLEEVEAFAKSTDWEVTETGWLLMKNSKYIVIASQFQKAGSWGNVTKIPASWVHRIQVLK